MVQHAFGRAGAGQQFVEADAVVATRAQGFEHRRDTLAADRRGTGPVAVHEKQTLLVELSSERVGVGVAVRQLRRDAEIEGIRGRST